MTISKDLDRVTNVEVQYEYVEVLLARGHFLLSSENTHVLIFSRIRSWVSRESYDMNEKSIKRKPRRLYRPMMSMTSHRKKRGKLIKQVIEAKLNNFIVSPGHYLFSVLVRFICSCSSCSRFLCIDVCKLFDT